MTLAGESLGRRSGTVSMSKHTITIIALLAVLCLTACAAGPNASEGTVAAGSIAGFWLGLWHGIIAPIAFVISLFVDTVHLYEVQNKGAWYNFGFVLGSGILFGGSSQASQRRRD